MVIGLLSFATGFVMFGSSGVVFSGDSVPDPSEEIFTDNSVSPKLHSIDIAGGYSDSDGGGISLENDGQVKIAATALGGSIYSENLLWAFNHVSDKAGLDIAAPYLPVAGLNSSDISGEYGRVGIEGKVTAIDASTDSAATAMGYVGFLKSSVASENNFSAHTIPIADGTPYAFYAGAGPTHLDNTVIDGRIANPSGDIVFNDDVYIPEDLTLEETSSSAQDGILTVNTLKYQLGSESNLGDRFGVLWAYRNSAGGPNALQGTQNTPNSDAMVAEGASFSVSVRCPADSYIVTCGGEVRGANAHAPYRGSYHSPNVNLEQGECKAWGRKPGPGSGNVGLYVYAYCYAPHETIPTWDID